MKTEAQLSSGISRRAFLGAGAAAGLAGVSGVACGEAASTVRAKPSGGAANTVASLDDNVYTRLLGVRPHLGAHEHISRLGGGRMPPDVMQAMAEANEYFVDMHELVAAASKRVAELIGAEAALVTAGGFSALILGAAACLTGTDAEKIEALPHPTWQKRECLIQKAQRFSYDRAYRAAGMTIVTADTRTDFLAHISPRTAMLAGLSISERQGVFAPPFSSKRSPPPDPGLIRAEELIAIGKEKNVPVLIDMASDLPPFGNIDRFLKAGADLVVVSGGKVIGGPQSSGILAGRKDLIEAATLNANPYENIGRGMKVGKEEIIGLVVALERFVKQDHDAMVTQWNERAKQLAGQLQGIAGLTAEYAPNTAGYADVALTWDESVIPLNRDTLHQWLASGKPRVELDVIVSKEKDTNVWHALARTRLLRDGEDRLVAQRLREVFQKDG